MKFGIDVMHGCGKKGDVLLKTLNRSWKDQRSSELTGIGKKYFREPKGRLKIKQKFGLVKVVAAKKEIIQSCDVAEANNFPHI